MRRRGMAGIAALAVLAYWGVWHLGFASDDPALVDRLQVRGLRAVLPYLDPLRAGHAGGYSLFFRPAWALSFWLDHLLWGTWAGGYHVTNLAIFAASGALVWLVVFEVSRDARAAWWAGALFILNPLKTFSAIWITGRTDGICALGTLGAVAAALAWRETGRRRWLVLALFSAVLALSGKEMGYLVPVFVAITEWARLRRLDDRRPVYRAFVSSLPFWCVAGLWALTIFGFTPIVGGITWSTSVGWTLRNWAVGLVLLVYPFDYEPLARFWQAHRAWNGPLAVVGIALATAAAIITWRRTGVRWGVLWIGVGLLPLYRLTMRWYLLIASIGVAIAGAFLVRGLERHFERSGSHVNVGTVIGAAVLVAWTVGLVHERMKWDRADAFTKRALASLVAIARSVPPHGQLVVAAAPMKLDRMPVFGGNLESFLHVAGVRGPAVSSIGLAALDRADARVSTEWSGGDTLDLRISGGAFVNYGTPEELALRNHPAPGTSIQTEVGNARVTACDRRQRIVGFDVTVPAAGDSLARFVTFDRGLFIALAPPGGYR